MPRVSYTEIFKAIVEDSQGFYNFMLTITSSFLGASILFMEKIAPHPNPCTLVLLVGGWVCFGVSLCILIYVRYQNMMSGRYALEGNFRKAKKLDRHKEIETLVAIIALIFGIVLLALFSSVNMVLDSKNPVPDRTSCVCGK